MEFEWDEAKSDRNLAKRGLPVTIAELPFAGLIVEHVDDRRDYCEKRMRAVGAVNGEIIHCVCTDRGSVPRIISLRHANRRERYG